LAVKTGEVATPDAFVSTVLLPANTPLGPVAGAVKVTLAPLTGFPPASLTVASKRDAKAVPVRALCGVPPVAAIEAAPPPVLVSAKLAVLAKPATDAVTA
jgi:hypothetical protein